MIVKQTVQVENEVPQVRGAPVERLLQSEGVGKSACGAPFDRFRIPPRQNLLLMPLIWLVCWFATRSGKLKIRRIGMKNLKPPFLVLATHHAFMDFFVTPLALFPHRANYVSELEGFEAYGEWIYRQAGCLGTRRFIDDFALVRNIERVAKRKDIIVIYPEARYATAGTSSEIPLSVAKLAKMLKIPVVILNMHGNYLQSPIWNIKIRKEVRLEAEISRLFTARELEDSDSSTIHQKIQDALHYDEYQWQSANKIKITAPYRAEGLEAVLYRCRQCGVEFQMKTKGAVISCGHCGASWHMSALGTLIPPPENTEGTHTEARIPDWYEWERAQVAEEIEHGAYTLDTTVKIESLPNAVSFIKLGAGRLRHDTEGFSLAFTGAGDTRASTLDFAPLTMSSVHTEYDYRGKGQCIVLSTLDNSYFLFMAENTRGFNVTKIQLATEYLYKRAKQSATRG
jgi:1-acyl-sn-glycerol-3-phosphate acyltransferase